MSLRATDIPHLEIEIRSYSGCCASAGVMTGLSQGGGAGGSTRLDGLMALLDTGTNMSVRRMAASQVGELVAAHPAEVRPVLRRVRKLLRSSNWDSRVAAGHALASIASSTPRFVPNVSSEAHSSMADTSKSDERSNVEDPVSSVISKTEPAASLNDQDIAQRLHTREPTVAEQRGNEGNEPQKAESISMQESVDMPEEGAWQNGLRLENLDLNFVMASGALLFGSSGAEYEGASIDVAQQRARLKADLGLDDRFTGGHDILDISDTDFTADGTSSATANAAQQQPEQLNQPSVDSLVEDMSIGNLSARERNRLKREAKKRARMSGSQSENEAMSKRPRSNGSTSAASDMQGDFPSSDGQDDFEEMYGSRYCDFQPTCEVLKRSLFDSRWETRHGSAIGLRHILAVHACSIGRRSFDPAMADSENARWLEDVSCRLLCVLTMDRFGDFVGDAVVAPVRETAAMALAAASRFMQHERAIKPMEQLLALLDSDQAKAHWEVRHALLLGVRYALAVQVDLQRVDLLLPIAFAPVATCLRDDDDDVRAVAAEALHPITNSIVSLLPDRVPGLVATLWDSLLDLDDISASTGSVLRLLTELSRIKPPSGQPFMWLDPAAFGDSSDSERDVESDPLTKNMVDGKSGAADDLFKTQPLVHLIPRIWPFLRHSAVSVRLASISLVDTLALADNNHNRAESYQWFRPLCGEVFEQLFRNILLENVMHVLQHTTRVWTALLAAFSSHSEDIHLVMESTAPLLSHWLRAASHETRAEASAFDAAKYKKSGESSRRRRSVAAARRAAKARAAKQAGFKTSNIGQDLEGSAPVAEGPFDGVSMQLNVSDALGRLAAIWPSNDSRLMDAVLSNLQSPYAVVRRVACDLCRSWSHHGQNIYYPPFLRHRLVEEMEGRGNCPFGEISSVAGGFFSDTITVLDHLGGVPGAPVDLGALRNTCDQGKLALQKGDDASAAIAARALHSHVTSTVTGTLWTSWEQHVRSSKASKRQYELISAVRQRILTSVGYMSVRLDELSTSLAASASSALVHAVGEELPQKVGPFIKCLTASSRTSRNPYFQKVAADGLAVLCERLSQRGTLKPLAVLVKNLAKHLTSLPVSKLGSVKDSTGDVNGAGGIVSGASGKRKFVDVTAGDLVQRTPVARDDPGFDSPEITFRGAVMTLHAFCARFGAEVFKILPTLWESIESGLCRNPREVRECDGKNLLVEAMTVLAVIVCKLSSDLHSASGTLFPPVIEHCGSSDQDVRAVAVQCLADMVAAMPGPGLQSIVHRLIPMLSGAKNFGNTMALSERQGAALALKEVVDRMGSALIPYAAFLIVPVMTRMVDEDVAVRDATSEIFGVLVRLMPLEGGAPDDPDMSATMSAERAEARQFLGQLLGTHPRNHYQMPVAIGDGVTLRKYQQECLDWLAFLNRYGLHGALCDDMGLGKTLMTLCIMAGDRVSMQTTSEGHDVSLCRLCPSLVVCPSTIAAHWVQECERFFPVALNPVVLYAGSPKSRSRIRCETSFESAALVVTSYDVLSNDLQFFSSVHWNYVVLDEGHVIKNSKTRVAKAVRALSPQHKLVLTGTPIQNSVLELWSLFDFLMPGFLGTEKSFREAFAKPILASRSTECTESDCEQGIVATEALHRQVLPFVLRRLKDDVLAELPPKIIQDYICNMTPLQVELYEDFTQEVTRKASDAIPGFEGTSEKVDSAKQMAGSHVFKVLSYLRRLCSHPKLVLNEKHPEYQRTMNKLSSQGTSLNDVTASSKLMGLRDILSECGIGDVETSGRESGGHRALIFAQLKQMLDIVETDLFRASMPQVTYMRLDGSVESSKRQAVVTRFNADPTIDCLLLTTNVGGLGLNLVGADTVIFLEHDWNPTKDLQAMDRAHRMGQKRTVNVYRLITRGTLEEKIMSMQKFKTHIANTVVNRENSSLQSMNTETLLSLFQVEGNEGTENDDVRASSSRGGSKSMKEAIANLGDLWEERQYEDEFNMIEFLAGMQSTGGGDSS